MVLETTTAPPIERLADKNWKAFEQWHPDTSLPTLAIPQDLLPVFIPEKVYDLASNPADVFIAGNQSQEQGSGSDMQIVIGNRNGYVLDSRGSGIDGMAEGLSVDLPDGGMPMIVFHARGFEAHPLSAWVEIYYDRPELTNRGIGTGFFKRVEKVLGSLGYKYLAGDLTSPNPDFFKKTMVSFNNLPQDVQKEVPTPNIEDTSSVLVRILGDNATI